MKRIIILILTIWPIAVSCEAYLDKAPDLGLSEEVIFNNFHSARGYLDECFNLLNNFANYDNQKNSRQHISQISDESANPYGGNLSNKFNKGIWYGENSLSEVGWSDANVYELSGLVIPKSFYGLRIANKIIETVPNMGNLTQDEKEQLLGQAYFFRGWFYFEIIRRVGGMPLLDRVFNSSDDLDMPRLNYWESSDWIIEQMDLAIPLLPDEWPSAEMGRPIKAAAYALKSMAELYSASPLMQNPVDRLEQKNDYNIERCKLAAQYAKECLEYIDTYAPRHKLMPKEEYKHIFYHSPNYVSDESLWYINCAGANVNSMIAHWQTVHFANRTGNWGQLNTSVSQNMIDKFETINGYPVRLEGRNWITDDPDFDPSAPFENRDPRLGHIVILPGEKFGMNKDKPNYLCTWEGGRDLVDVPSTGIVATRYLVKKFQWETAVYNYGSNPTEGQRDYYFSCIHIRTAQVWLDYAEAMNEAYGPTGKPEGYTYSAVDAINVIRERVGMCPVREEFTKDALTFRERIRNERAIELIFENHRWFDIRRWMIAEEVFSPTYPIRGVKVTASNATKTEPLPSNVFTYEELFLQNEVRVFEMRQYWYPVGKDEAQRMTKFKQNPGW